jgi:putative peptidoglycan lipid II flippase
VVSKEFPQPLPLYSVSRASLILTLGAILARVTGLMRLTSIAFAIGIAETRLTDTYNLANSVPNLLYDLLLGGFISAALVPVLVDLRVRQTESWDVMMAMLNWSLIIAAVLAGLGMLGAPTIAKGYAARLAGDEALLQEEAMVTLLRFFMPQIVFYTLAAFSTAILNAHHRFAVSALTPILNNLLVTATFLALASKFSTKALGSIDQGTLGLIGIGTTLGVAAMAVGQLPSLIRINRYRWTLRLKWLDFRAHSNVAIYGVCFAIVSVCEFLAIQWIANSKTGVVSAYVSASIFALLPFGLLSSPITTALTPALAKDASTRDWTAFRLRLGSGLRLMLVLILPTVVLFQLIGEELVLVVVQQGVATAQSTRLVYTLLRWLALGILPYSVFTLLVRASYSVQDARRPLYMRILAFLVLVLFGATLFGRLGETALGIAFVMSNTVGMSIQAIILYRAGLGPQFNVGSLTNFGLRLCLGAATMIMSMIVGGMLLSHTLLSTSRFGSITAVMLEGILGLLAYTLTLRVLGIPEVDTVTTKLRELMRV